MNPEQIHLVQSTWREVAPMSADAAKLFYGRLFELDPALRPLFRSSLDDQGRKLMSMIGAAVNGLSDGAALVPVVQDLGRRHARYGVRDRHYDTVGVALLWTLEKGLGSGFTPTVRDAWAEAYGTLASLMKTAAAEMAA